MLLLSAIGSWSIRNIQQTLFKPESKYDYSAHDYRSSPWLQIYEARHMEIDTTEYQTNRAYYSKLYKSMKTAGIPHSDILMVYGNPYINVASNWYSLGNKRWNVIEKEYPGVWSVAGIGKYINKEAFCYAETAQLRALAFV